MAPQAKKKIRYGSFYITYSLNETFFCGAKKEKWRRRQKKIEVQTG